jgi:hypothetical protein
MLMESTFARYDLAELVHKMMLVQISLVVDLLK